jgi:hypothetical protein
MMVKSAQLVGVGGAGLSPFTLSNITSKFVVYVPAERADALSLFLLYPCMYSVAGAASKVGLSTIYCTLYSTGCTSWMVGCESRQVGGWLNVYYVLYSVQAVPAG